MTQAELKENIKYDPITGICIWIKRKQRRKLNQLPIGYLNNIGHITLTFNGKKYLLHRLIWLYEYGCFPECEIDHINHNKTDNRLLNLKEATRSENMRNKRLHKNNTSGHHGININSHGNWEARISDSGKTIYIGSFKTKNEAIIERKKYEEKYNYHNNHGKQ